MKLCIWPAGNLIRGASSEVERRVRVRFIDPKPLGSSCHLSLVTCHSSLLDSDRYKRSDSFPVQPRDAAVAYCGKARDTRSILNAAVKRAAGHFLQGPKWQGPMRPRGPRGYHMNMIGGEGVLVLLVYLGNRTDTDHGMIRTVNPSESGQVIYKATSPQRAFPSRSLLHRMMEVHSCRRSSARLLGVSGV